MLGQDDVIYFLVTDRFCDGDSGNNQDANPSNPRAFHGGDFAGLTNKIPYFQTLGITAVWITPVYVNIADFFDSMGYHGYWPMDFERVDSHLYSRKPQLAEGSRAYLRELVDAFHAAGIKIVLDVVVNHTGYHTPAYAAYPHKRFESRHFNSPRPDDATEHWLSGLPDLDHDRPEVGDYFVQNILDWVEETGIDGIRMDTVRHVEDTFWYLFKSQIKTRHPQVTLLGEVLDWEPASIGRYQREHDFDTLFDFPLCGAVKGTLVWDQPMTRLARPRLSPDEPKGMLDRDKAYTNANRLVTLLDNHDLERRITTEILDRVGHWDRDLASKILRLCLSFLFTTRGIPQIYYGTEIGMEGRRDPDNRRDMPWSVFGPDHRPLESRRFERDIFDHVTRLIKLRAKHPAIRYGYLLTLYADEFLYAYLREFRGDVVLVVINNGRGPMPFPVSIDIAGNSNIPVRIKQLLVDGTVLVSECAELPDVTVCSGNLRVQLPSKAAGIYTAQLQPA
ncbi:MAG: alpha-amylase family glycosyl hydrolase [Planctomycetota bacterium]|jgi:alpha-amylase